MSLKKVLELLPELSKKDLEHVKNRVAFLSGSGSTPSPEDDWLLEGLALELKRRGLGSGNLVKVLRLQLPKNYAETSIEMQGFLRRGCPQKEFTRAEKLALGALAGYVLAEYLLAAKVPVGPRTLVTNVGKIPQALEKSFPGYWSSRLLHFIWNKGINADQGRDTAGEGRLQGTAAFPPPQQRAD